MSQLTTRYVHGTNLTNKLEALQRQSRLSSADKLKLAVISGMLDCYNQFKEKLRYGLAAANDSDDYSTVTELINNYFDFAKAYECESGSFLTARTKYYSSILEELPVHIVLPTVQAHLSKHPLHNDGRLTLGDIECTIRVGAGPDGRPFYEKKKIDFAIGLDAGHINFGPIPLLGLEVKAYVDKVMFGTILETHRALANFRPRTYYGFLTEDESRGKDVVLNSPIYKNEFLLTGEGRPSDSLPTGYRNPIRAYRLKNFVEEIRSAAVAAIRTTQEKL